ncbi:AMP-binding protein [Dactylosporangium fulvum]|uniref:AMP-binding protein n=1 Tax=Dactylosporangium fulvum TaxID=53359 RepID=A0ABY5VQR6_9ACTN|nr:AMP-binding protein [Dactylosporangium fulvum]UWP79885.1 AMP-binding protein [Dactylosporangium fulvum]
MTATTTVPLGRILTNLAAAEPDHPIVTCGDETVTRSELESRANRLARAYESLGVRPGDFVTTALPNGVEFYAATFALWKLGAIPQLVSPQLPGRERSAIVELADPSLIVGVTPGSHGDRPTVPAGYRPDPGLSDAPIEPDRVPPAWKAPTSGGSTGRPKLIVSELPGAIVPTEIADLLGQHDHGVQLVPGPLYHNAPFNFSMYGLFAGQHLVVLPRFDPVAALTAIERHRVDWVGLVPTMMVRIWREIEAAPGRYDLSSLRQVFHGAAPCPPWLKEVWFSLVGAANVKEMYATTEGQLITLLDGDEWLRHRGSVGRPIRGELRILDADGAAVPPGQVGELFTRTGEGMPSTYRYIGAEPRSRDGWESVGDLGRLDADGYLYLADRRTDLIITGGSNVYPAEVEAALLAHPAVVSCAVIGLPDDDLGQRVHAVVQAGSAVTDDELRGFLADRLVRYKIPRSFRYTDAPVRDDAGKVRRSALRDQELRRLSGGRPAQPA